MTEQTVTKTVRPLRDRSLFPPRRWRSRIILWTYVNTMHRKQMYSMWEVMYCIVAL